MNVYVGCLVPVYGTVCVCVLVLVYVYRLPSYQQVYAPFTGAEKQA